MCYENNVIFVHRHASHIQIRYSFSRRYTFHNKHESRMDSNCALNGLILYLLLPAKFRHHLMLQNHSFQCRLMFSRCCRSSLTGLEASCVPNVLFLTTGTTSVRQRFGSRLPNSVRFSSDRTSLLPKQNRMETRSPCNPSRVRLE